MTKIFEKVNIILRVYPKKDDFTEILSDFLSLLMEVTFFDTTQGCVRLNPDTIQSLHNQVLTADALYPS